MNSLSRAWARSEKMDTTRTLKEKVIKEKKFFYLTILHTPDEGNQGKTLQVPEGEIFIGRETDESEGIRISDTLISRKHVSIRLSHGKLRLADLSSKNGTFVNGKKVRECALEHNDIIRMGDSIIYVASLDINIPPPLSEEIEIKGRSPAIRVAVEKSFNISKTLHPVLITGESGTGKELFAHFIHKNSGRRGLFVPINCAAIPENLVESTLFGHKKGAFTGAASDSSGYFQAANKGTLFLDEIAELPLEQQAKLLRAIENGEIFPVGMSTPVKIDARFITATNRNLKEIVDAGRFRGDLYARLSRYEIDIQPLRERRDDIPLIIREIAKRENLPEMKFDADAMEALLLHHYEFNVRSLSKIVLQAVMSSRSSSSPIGLAALPHDVREKILNRGKDENFESREISMTPKRDRLIELLQESGGNVAHAATILRKDRKQIYRWIEQEKLDLSQFRKEGQGRRR